MKTGKQLVSIFTVFSMLLILFVSPAYAVSGENNTSVFEGTIPTIEITETANGFILNTYKNNMLSSSITWNRGEDTMQKTLYGSTRSLSSVSQYTINISDYLTTHATDITEISTLAVSDWYYLKTAVYNSRPTLSESVSVWYRSTGISEKPYLVSTYAGSVYEDVVAVFTTCLIDVGINLICASAGIPLASYSAQFMVWALAEQGAKVVNGIIDRATSFEVECVRYSQEVRGYSTYNKNYGTTYSGDHGFVFYNGSSSPQDFTIIDSGWTAYNVMCSEFAAIMWSDFHPGITNPGLARWS